MPSHDPIAEEYVLLALRMDRHSPGLVDAYIGPAELKASVEAEPLRPLGALADDAARLAEAVCGAGFAAERAEFLSKQVGAMQMTLRRLRGEDVPYVEEVQACFDITPARTPESEFDQALRKVDSLLPGRGDLAQRQLEWKHQFELPSASVLPVMEAALAEVRRRTMDMIGLPDRESVELELVSGQPWSGYNWYLGQGRSRVQINTDLPVRTDDALDFMAHEGYPGHHTECVLKEQLLYQQAGQLEHSVAVLLAPECLIAEGIATVAKDVIFLDPQEKASWLGNVLYPLAAMQVDVGLQLELERVSEPLSRLSDNVGFMLHQDGKPEAEVVEYVRHYGLRTALEAQRTVAFVNNPLYRAYIFNYSHGRRLLKQAFAARGVLDIFRWVLTTPVTPSSVAARVGASSEV
jgi:hypothetical protein